MDAETKFLWILLNRKKRLESELQQMLWKVRFEDVLTMKKRVNSVVCVHCLHKTIKPSSIYLTAFLFKTNFMQNINGVLIKLLPLEYLNVLFTYLLPSKLRHLSDYAIRFFQLQWKLKWILSYFYQLGSMRSMMSQVSGRTGSRSSSDERTKAHESQLYTEVRMRTSVWNWKLHVHLNPVQLLFHFFSWTRNKSWAKSEKDLIQFVLYFCRLAHTRAC